MFFVVLFEEKDECVATKGVCPGKDDNDNDEDEDDADNDNGCLLLINELWFSGIAGYDVVVGMLLLSSN